MSSEQTEDEDTAKEYRRALNTKRRPLPKRLLKTTVSSNDSSSITSTASSTVSFENVPVYREVEQAPITPKIKKMLYRACPEPIRNAIKPPTTREAWKKFLQIHFPIVYWVLKYTPKLLVGDIVSGLTIGVTHIPQGIGFALLAAVPPVFGLYSSFLPVVLYSIFGTSRHLSVGTFPVVALMVGEAVTSISHPECDGPDGISSNASMNSSYDNLMNLTMMGGDSCALDSCNSRRVDIAITLSLVVGLIMIVMSLLKLGVITIFLSDALISGYTAAAAFSIVITQMKNLFGISRDDVTPGLFVTPRRFYGYFNAIVTGDAVPSAIVTSIICMALLICTDLLNYLLKKKVRKVTIHIPGQLIVVILATSISYGAELSTRTDLPVINDVGGIPHGRCFRPTLPVGSLVPDVIANGITIAIIGFVINIAQAKLLAQKNEYSIYPDQELFAYGIMNLGGSFFGAFPTAGALSRTVLQNITGGHTQLVGLISSAIVLLVILFLGTLFGPLPNSAIGAIVVMALKGLLFQVRDIRKYFHLHWPDMFVWLVTFKATLIVGLDIGLGIGVLFSMFIILLRTILPFSPELGEAKMWVYPRHVKNRELDDINDEDLTVRRLAGICIFQFNAPLYFANCGVFRARLFLESGVDPHHFDRPMKGCFEQCYYQVKDERRERLERDQGMVQSKEKFGFLEESPNDLLLEETQTEVPSSVVPDTTDFLRHELHELAKLRATDVYHTIILDCGPIGFVDSMGMAMLEKVVQEFDAINIQVLLAAPSTPICKALHRYGFFKRYSAERIFSSVSNAVQYARRGNRVPFVEEPERLDKKLATNLERQLALSTRPKLLELKTGLDPPRELDRRSSQNKYDILETVV